MTTSRTSRLSNPKSAHPMWKAAGAALLAATMGACSSKDLNITNPNTPSVEGALADPAAFQLQATGLLQRYRGTRLGFISETGRFGRESYIFTPTEGRNTTHYLIGITVGGVQKLDPSGFAVGQWGAQYANLRDIFNFKNTATASAALSAAQREASLGFAKTIEAAMLMEVIGTRDSLGAVVDINLDATQLGAFVSRDSVYKYILAMLDQAAAHLAAGGTAFPFVLHSGFTGFNTPTNFRLFNQALRARASAWYATRGGGAAAWQAALTALTASFYNAGAATRAALDVGVFHPYSATTGDALNGLSQAVTSTLYAHMSIQADVQLKANGQPDDRYTAKIRTGLPARSGAAPGTSATSTLGFSIWPTSTTPVPVVRNEELILLHAEAMLATGNKAGAIADINQIRTVSGGLAPTTLTPASSDDAILTEILYNKRYSLLMEGHRWIDHRRYNKLNLLPLDITSGTNKNFVAIVMPIPQAECLQRVGKTGALAGPGC